MASAPITSWQIEGEEVEAMTDFLYSTYKQYHMMFVFVFLIMMIYNNELLFHSLL